MKTPFIVTLCVLFCGLANAAEPAGIPPRTDRTQYSITGFTHTLAVGATLVSADQVRRIFGPALDAGFVVVEVAFYSKTRQAFPVRHNDFGLLFDKRSKTPVKPLKPSEVVRAVRGRGIAPSERDLLEKSLPESITNAVLAGYLIFPANVARRNWLGLDYTGNGTWMTLPLD